LQAKSIVLCFNRLAGGLEECRQVISLLLPAGMRLQFDRGWILNDIPGNWRHTA
jgi:hypothetical protein